MRVFKFGIAVTNFFLSFVNHQHFFGYFFNERTFGVFYNKSKLLQK